MTKNELWEVFTVRRMVGIKERKLNVEIENIQTHVVDIVR